MQRKDLKLIVDGLLYTFIGVIASTGLILGVILPPGRGARWFLGLHRHDWGDIHGFFAVLLVLLLVVHVVLNWSWVTASMKRVLGRPWPKRLFFLSWAWLALLFVSWFFVRCT